MKKISLVFLSVAAIALLALNPLSDPLPIGAPIPHPELKMKEIHGKEISFKEATMKNGLLVMFSCNTCPVVHKYEARTVAICKTALQKDIGVVLLNSNEAYRDNGDSYEDMKKYAKKLGYTFNYAIDINSVMADAFGATRTPECFLFNNEGKLVYHGAIDDNSSDTSGSTPYLQNAFDNLLKGKKIDPEKTRSVGCGIKRL